MNCDRDTERELQPVPAATGPLRFQITMTSSSRLLSVVRAAISELAAIHGFDDRQCRRITLAIDEALSNVIRHSYQNRCDRQIELICQVRSNCLEFAFLDCGEPADPARFCAQPLDETGRGGRGTHIIRQVMDEVRYDRVPEGNRLRLKKYLPGAEALRAANESRRGEIG